MRRARTRQDWPDTLAFQITASNRGLSVSHEYRFHPERKWRFDLAIVARKLAIEVDGGGFVNGRHSRGTGIEKDAEKFAEAAILGWTVLRCTPKQVKSGEALQWIERLIQAKLTPGGDRV